MATPKLETRGLTRVADSAILVDSVDLRVGEAEVLAVTGPSGAGKTSLLRLLNRLDEPTDGAVLLDGVDARRIPPRELRRRVGLVAQRPALWEGSALDNVTLGPRLRGEPPDPRRAKALLARLGLHGLEDRPADRLSGGEAQRVAVARALMNGPEVLLMDEPAAGLDQDAKASLESLLAELVRDLGLTALLVTHDRAHAERLADGFVELRDGRVVESATGGEVNA